jgi:hypothetical protein
MDHFWSEITEHFPSALRKAEILGNEDMQTLAEIPEILNYLKGLTPEDLLLLLDHASQINKRRPPEFQLLNSDFSILENVFKPNEQEFLAKAQSGLRIETSSAVRLEHKKA